MVFKSVEEKPVEQEPIKDSSLKDDSLVSDMPQVVQEAVNASIEKETAPSSIYKDHKGRPFDPDLHACKPDGTPEFTPTGRFKRKVAGATRQAVPGATVPGGMQQNAPNYRVVAETLVGAFIQVGYGFVGDEWLPEKTRDFNEAENLVNVTETYVASIGMTDLPPGVVVVTAFGMYAVRRLQKKESRTKTLFQKTALFFKDTFQKISAKLSKSPARPVKKEKPEAE